MKKFLLGMLAVFFFLGLPLSPVFAGEVDVLLEKLVEKGILTQSEANIIRDETEQKVKGDLAQGIAYSVPQWVQKMRVSGDFRMRYQLEKRNGNEDARTRARIRYRLGIETDIVKNVKIGFGLASGGADPRSTNQTLQDTFSHKTIMLDTAFAEWTPTPEARFIMGKFKRDDYLWQTTDTFWDDDIRPEGGAAHLERDLFNNVKGFVNGGVLALDEVDNTVPYEYMYYGQGGVAWTPSDKFDAKVANTYYGFNQIKGRRLDNTGCTNSGLSGTNSSCSGLLTYNYTSIGGTVEVGFNKLFDTLYRLAFFGDFNRNISDGVKDDESGYGVGMRIGDVKVDGPKKWQVSYVRKWLGKDAIPDILNDSDSYDKSTDIEGHIAKVTYGLTKNVTFGINYFDFNRIKASKNEERLLQADLVFKF